MMIRVVALLAIMLPANCCPWGACYVRERNGDVSCFMADDAQVCRAYNGWFQEHEWCKR